MLSSRSRRFQGFQYRLRFWYQIKVWAIPIPISRPRDGQNSLPIPIVISILCKCYTVKYEEMSQFIEWGTQKYKISIPRLILIPRDVQNSIPIPIPGNLVSRFRSDSDSIADPWSKPYVPPFCLPSKMRTLFVTFCHDLLNEMIRLPQNAAER